VTLVDLPRTEVDERLVGSGWGGDGWDGRDDDPGDGWGWSEEPFDDDLPYRRPRLIRALAIVLVFVVITGSIGAYVALMTLGSGDQYFVGDVALAVPRGTTSAEVSFVLSNQSAQGGRARCTATVKDAQATVGSATALTGRLHGGGSTRFVVRVPLSSPIRTDGGPAAAEVGCVPAGHRSS
jgi:hypothetical protein